MHEVWDAISVTAVIDVSYFNAIYVNRRWNKGPCQ